HGQIIFELAITDQAFNTSGDYERYVIKDGVRYHHILDARTGFPARGTRSVTLLAGDAFTADALDTDIFAVGPARGLQIVAGVPVHAGCGAGLGSPLVAVGRDEVRVIAGAREGHEVAVDEHEVGQGGAARDVVAPGHTVDRAHAPAALGLAGLAAAHRHHHAV